MTPPDPNQCEYVADCGKLVVNCLLKRNHGEGGHIMSSKYRFQVTDPVWRRYDEGDQGKEG